MKKNVLSFVLYFTFFCLNWVSVVADEAKNWNFSGLTTMGFSQVSLSNWASGGDESYALNGIVNLDLNYAKGNTTWENSLDLGYGILKQSSLELRKSDDKIDFASKFAYTATKHWNYSALIGFKTQFTDGYKYKINEPNELISSIMAPAYFTTSVGMEYKKNENLYVLISPVAGKMTFVYNDVLSSVGAFGVGAGENLRSEFGGYLKAEYKKDNLIKNVGIKTKIELFSNYIENPQFIDVDWELMLLMKINSLLSANIKTQIIYDEDINGKDKAFPGIQFKEVLSIGLTYKF